ncbi:Lysozyme [Mesorhizobium plurifarium]|uniref:Lysozyme n=1 Tax=Mesorhizobium plurifarium TaxID=69974 RepID=A0A090E9M6_MESPL|nr:Lysozyme [Mesorhizobium plurifarium]
MRLVTDWRRVVLLSLSFWMQILGIAVLVLPEFWYRLTEQDYDPNIAWWLGLGLLVAGVGGRLLEQGLSPWKEWLRITAVGVIVFLLAVLLAWPSAAAPGNKAPAIEAETLDIAVPFIAREEGERLVAYRDAVGVPTIGFGHTDGVYMGMVITHEQALDMLRQDVAKHRTGLHRYFVPATIFVRLPPTRDAAYTSTAFNVGVAGIGKSTATRRLNAGDIVGGCDALTWFDRAGKRVLRGLFERRQREKKLCLQGPSS